MADRVSESSLVRGESTHTVSYVSPPSRIEDEYSRRELYPLESRSLPRLARQRNLASVLPSVFTPSRRFGIRFIHTGLVDNEKRLSHAVEDARAVSESYRYNRRRVPLESYRSVVSEEEIPVGSACQTAYSPSSRVTSAFLKAGESVIEDFRKDLAYLPKEFLGPSERRTENLLRETAGALTLAVEAALHTLAFQAAAFGGRTASVSDSHGEFAETFKRVLYESLAVRMNDMPRLLTLLHEDLEQFAIRNPSLGSWGTLYLAPNGLFIRVTVILPIEFNGA